MDKMLYLMEKLSQDMYNMSWHDLGKKEKAEVQRKMEEINAALHSQTNKEIMNLTKSEIGLLALLVTKK